MLVSVQREFPTNRIVGERFKDDVPPTARGVLMRPSKPLEHQMETSMTIPNKQFSGTPTARQLEIYKNEATKATPGKPATVPRDVIEKGVRGLQ